MASSIEGYDNFRRDFGFNKIRPDGGTLNPIVAVAIMFVINSVPIVLKFLLINLLVHLLLRGFWIGIVGLSSVSSSIHFDKLNLKGSFKKFIPNKVRPLDNLIVYLDKVSSVIFCLYLFVGVFHYFCGIGCERGFLTGGSDSLAWNIGSKSSHYFIWNSACWGAHILVFYGGYCLFHGHTAFQCF